MHSTQTTLAVLSTAITACLIAFSISRYLAPSHSTSTSSSQSRKSTELPHPHPNSTTILLCTSLGAALPNDTFFPADAAYRASKNSYWSLNARASSPACILRPSTARDVSAAIQRLKSAYDALPDSPPRFTVRSGGHSPEAGFSDIDGGVLIDLSRINNVEVGTAQTVTIGVGAPWRDVYSRLDALGLAMVGGRNADVGVGGLVLGGGISFFSPRFGMVCDNVEAYEVVLADGSMRWVTADGEDADLWRALKGGSGNFGVVTRVRARTFVAGEIWSGYAYWTWWQAPKVIAAFHEFNMPENFDEFAAGPIVAICYNQMLGIKLVAGGLVYTKPEKWPPVFKPFRAFRRVWSTMKTQSVTAAASELDSLSLSGQRQFMVTTTVKNDLSTLLSFSDIFHKSTGHVKGVKGGIWSLIFQPLSASITRKGSPTVLGLETRPASETLIIVLVAVTWKHAEDDHLVHRVARDMIDECEKVALEKGTADPYKYLNYAASGQDVFGGYGEANLKFMSNVSRKYDPQGFFQRARRGGFHIEGDSP